jgi:ABC-2 type transport system permease protein
VTTDRRGWRDHPLIQLTLVRYREFYREPEAIFWVFIFPVLLTAGLGIAFRSRAPERVPVALVARAGADDTLAARLTAAGGLRLRVLDDRAAA